MKRTAAAALTLAACASAPALDESRALDLTYAFDESTIYWPTAEPFRLERVDWGRDESGRWYAAARFCASEHGGTHLDAPLHFAEGRRANADIPLEQLIGPARVIDVRQAAQRERDHALSTEEILDHERRHGRIPPGAIVLVRTGWGRYWGDPRRYLGSAERGSAENLHFPGISADAARLLVQRRAALVGIDTASLDPGPSREFAAHRVLAEADVAGLENLARLEALPEVGATVIALPMKIAGGTGGPARVIAFLP